MAEPQILRMARPAAYWARRAAFHHRRGNRQQAGLLYQHAVSLTPDNLPLKLAYARVLREMHRYEASNRQAFAVLAQDPAYPGCVGLIGQNLLALGYLEEAADAFTHELNSDPANMTETHADLLDRLDRLLDTAEEPGVRYHLLVRRATEYIAAGAWEAARQTLAHTCAMPRRDERCHTLMALYYQAAGNMDGAIRQAVAACNTPPHSPRSYCSLAELYGINQQRGKAFAALVCAARRVLTAEDERLLCRSAIRLRLSAAVLPTLRQLGSCVHTLFNQSVLYLMAGQPQPALQALDQCCALDPDDVPSRYLRRRAQAIALLPRGQIKAQAAALRLYPALSDTDSEACFRSFMEVFQQGPAAFARRLQTDPAYYRLALYQAENPNVDISGMLEQGIVHLEENFTLKLLREILILPTGGVAEKQLAIQVLLRSKAQPFALWHDGRLSFINPHGSNETSVEMRLRDHLLYAAGTGASPRLVAHALRLIRRLPPRVRLKIAAAQPGAFFAAVRLHAVQAPDSAAPQPRHVLRIYHMLARTAPAPDPSPNPPRLWLTGGREETHETD